MPSEQQIDRFERVIEPEKDSYLSKIIQLHGPFDSEETIKNDTHTVVKCIACYVPWPCTTFLTFEQRHQQTK